MSDIVSGAAAWLARDHYPLWYEYGARIRPYFLVIDAACADGSTGQYGEGAVVDDFAPPCSPQDMRLLQEEEAAFERMRQEETRATLRGTRLRTVGFDHQREPLPAARACGLTVVQGDLQAIPFKSGIGDAVQCVGALSCLSDARAVEKAVGELFRVAKRGASLYLDVPVRTVHTDRVSVGGQYVSQGAARQWVSILGGKIDNEQFTDLGRGTAILHLLCTR
jgi:hypothetical protein